MQSRLLAAAAVCVASASALATPVTVTTPFFNLENIAVNSLGSTPGQLVRFGAVSVVPNGNAGTTGLATMDGTNIGRTLSFNPGPAIQNFFARYLFDDPLYRGNWTLTFANGGDTATRSVFLDSSAQQVHFVNSITLSGPSTNPTFSWTPPPNTVVNGYRINIFDKSLIGPNNNGLIINSINVPPSVTSHTVTAGNFTVAGQSFALGKNYSIEISLIQTKDGTSSNLGNSNVQAISRVYADFTPTQSGGPVVNLPVVLANGSFQFNMTVTAGQTYYIDPAIAVGYDYEIGAGNPNFTSVDLPDNIGDGLYDIYRFDGNGNEVLLADDWNGANVFTFAAGGVSHFKVLGIETSAGLNPGSTTAFVTGLTFAGSGQFTGTQTPITVQVNDVPEPSSLALTTLTLLGLTWRRRRHG